MENCRWLEKVIIEERGNCIFWCKEKGAKLQTGCTGPFWFTACNQDRSKILALLGPYEFLKITGETCIFLSIGSFLKSIHC